MFSRVVPIYTLLTSLAMAATPVLAANESALPSQLAQASSAESSDVTPTDAPAGEPAIAWETFVSDSGQFQIAMPSQPATYIFSPGISATDSLMYMQMQLADTDRLEIYAAAFITSADFVDSRENLDAALLSCVTSLSDQTLQTVPQSITLGQHQGIEAEFRDDSGLLQVSRCYLVGDRAYLLTASSEPFDAGSGLMPLENADETSVETPVDTPADRQEDMEVRSPTMELFFNSFEILDE